MYKHVFKIILIFPIFALFDCSEKPNSLFRPPDITETQFSELMQFYEGKEYFKLKNKLDSIEKTDSPFIQFFIAIEKHAFNKSEESNNIIESLLEETALPDSLKIKLQRIQLSNLIRLFNYSDAYENANTLLSILDVSIDSAEIADVSNTAKLLNSLVGVPAQETVIKESTTLKLDSGRIPLQIGENDRSFIFDTGANFSILMRSEANLLQLEVVEAGLEVSTSTDIKVFADIAVADNLTIGNIEFRNVVFLVLPDEALTFPGGFRIPGIIGYPVIEALGEIRFQGNDFIEIPETPSIYTQTKNKQTNIALDNLNLIVNLDYESQSLIGGLDTGANKSVMYEPFFRQYRERIENLGSADSIRTGGVGGIRILPVYKLPDFKMVIGGKTVTLTEIDIYTESIRRNEENYLYFNIGHDILDQFNEYIINFRLMQFSLK